MAKLEALKEPFSGSVLDPAKWSVSGSPIMADDHLKMSVGTSGSSISTVAQYDLTNSQVSAKLDVQSPDAATRVNFTITVDAANKLEFVLVENVLHTKLIRNGVVSDTTFEFDPDVQLWWRIREKDGLAYWDTSLDGAKWTNLRIAAHQMDIRFVEFSLSTRISIGTGFGYGPFGGIPFGGGLSPCDYGVGLYDTGIYGCVSEDA